MAKKKKHRKKPKGNSAKKQQKRAVQPVGAAEPKQSTKKSASKTVAKASKSKSSIAKTKPKEENTGLNQDVKADVMLSMSLIGFVAAAYAILWFVLQYSSFGKSIYQIIKL